MDLVLLIIILLLVVVIFKPKTSNTDIENFWDINLSPNDIAKKQCSNLTLESEEIKKYKEVCKNVNNDLFNERSIINKGIECKDATDREIFNDKERHIWCKDKDDEIMMHVEPEDILTKEALIKVILNDHTSNFDYKYIDNSNFLPNDIDKAYSGI